MDNEVHLPEPIVQIVGTITRADGKVEEFVATTRKEVGHGGPGHGDNADDNSEERSVRRDR